MVGRLLTDRAERFRWRLPVAFGPSLATVKAGFTKDLSVSGCAVQTRLPVRAGTPLQLAMRLPDGLYVRATALVVWSRSPLVAGTLGAMGLRLDSVEDAYFNFLLVVANPVLRIPATDVG